MKLGVLEADKLSREIQQTFGNYGDMFQRLLGSITPAADDELTFQNYQVTEFDYPKTIDDCDAYLITGSQFSVYENAPWIKQLQDYVIKLVDRPKKLIGICFGHQIIAQALGGEVQKNKQGWGIGMASSTVYQSKPWMRPAKQSFALLVSHQDQVMKLPPQAELLAGDDFCPHASYQIGEHILCFQGHPEFTQDYLKSRMWTRRELIGEQRFQQGLASLIQITDHTLIAQWLVNFVKQNQLPK